MTAAAATTADLRARGVSVRQFAACDGGQAYSDRHGEQEEGRHEDILDRASRVRVAPAPSLISRMGDLLVSVPRRHSA